LTSAPALVEPVAQPEPQRVEPQPAPPPAEPVAAEPAGDTLTPPPVTGAAAGVAATSNVASFASAPAAAPAAAPTPIDDERAVSLEFSFEQESWAEVTDARGERLLFGLNAAGRTLRVRGEAPFAVVLGNANVVRLTVDGEPYEIPLTGRQGDLVRFAVEISGD
jgi:cytoskeleton protein RodZ